MPDDPTAEHDTPIAYTQAWAFSISGEDGGLVVRVGYEGNVEFGEGVTPDAAAVAFYNVVAGYAQRDPAHDAIRAGLERGRQADGAAL